jgi:hypothetical protein
MAGTVITISKLGFLPIGKTNHKAFNSKLVAEMDCFILPES